MRSTVVLLNGVGSAGKTSIARALQTMTRAPFLHVAMDSFLDMLPPALLDHADGLRFSEGADGVAIHTGPVAARTFDAMRRAIAAMADTGCDMIVDDVMLGDEMAEYERLLAGHRLLRVAVLAPIDVLAARERARGNRMVGLARWQFDRVHYGRTYDLEVDTAAARPEECARRIAEAFAL